MSIAFIFPGQGSQTLGMLGTIAEENTQYADIISHTFKQASDILDYDLWALTQIGPEADLNKTQYTQPAILSASYALWQIWRSKQGLMPIVMAGHSLGEYTALVCAEALEFSEAIDLVAHRGKFMQNAVVPGEGAMAAILGLDDDMIIAICAEIVAKNAHTQVVSAVNFNSPGQVVIAGHSDAVDQAMNAAHQAGAKKVIKLAVSVPSHCALMDDAAIQLAEKLATISIKTPVTPVFNNVHATIENDAKAIRETLVAQLSQPVQWVTIINNIIATGAEHIIECGPGKVLTGLNRRINRRMPASPMFDVTTIDKNFEAIRLCQ
jgi:[acyl-carrier-protein] S-malonyltransferase